MSNLLAMLADIHVVQAVIIGAVLAFLTANVFMSVVMRAATTTVNG
jgi:hypothetical protein